MRDDPPHGCVIRSVPIPVSVKEYQYLMRFLNQACGDPLNSFVLSKWIKKDEELEEDEELEKEEKLKKQAGGDNLDLESFFTLLHRSQADRVQHILTSLLVHLICSDDYGDDFTAIHNTWDEIQRYFNPNNLVSVRVGEADYDFSLSSLAIAYGRDYVIKQLHNPDGGCQSFQDGECFLKACEIAITHIGTEAFYNVLIDLLFDGKITDPEQMRKIYERYLTLPVQNNDERQCTGDFSNAVRENRYPLAKVIFDMLSSENKQRAILCVLDQSNCCLGSNIDALLEAGLDPRLLIDGVMVNSDTFEAVLDSLGKKYNLLFIANLTLDAIGERIKEKKDLLDSLSWEIRYSNAEELHAHKEADGLVNLGQLVEYALHNDADLFDYLLGWDPSLGAIQDKEGCYIIDKVSRECSKIPSKFDLAHSVMLLHKINRIGLCKFLISASYIVALLKKQGLTDKDMVNLEKSLIAQGHPNAARKIWCDIVSDDLKLSVDVNNISMLQMLWFCLRSIFYSIFCCCVPTSTSASHTLFSDGSVDSTDAGHERWNSLSTSVGDDDGGRVGIKAVV